MSGQMLITVHEDQADSERLDELTAALRRELLDYGVDDVGRVDAGPAPEGTRGFDAHVVGALMVAFQQSVPVVGGIVALVRAWLSAAPAGRSVELVVGDRSLKVSSVSKEQQERLISEFVAAVSRSGTATPVPET